MAVQSVLKKFGTQYWIEFQELINHLAKKSPTIRNQVLQFNGLSGMLGQLNKDGVLLAWSGSKFSETTLQFTDCYIELNSLLTLIFELKLDYELVLKDMIYQLRESSLCKVECSTQTEDNLEAHPQHNTCTTLDCGIQTENNAGLEMAMELLGVSEKINIKTESNFDASIEDMVGNVHSADDSGVQKRRNKPHIKKMNKKHKCKDMTNEEGTFFQI